MNHWNGLLAISQNLQTSALILGVAGIGLGIFLFKVHQELFAKATSQNPNAALLRFEKNKLQRRSLVAGLVSSTGCFMAAIYWVSEVKILAILTLLMICQLVLILALAAIDLFAIYLRQIARSDKGEQRRILEAYLKEKSKQEPAGTTPES